MIIYQQQRWTKEQLAERVAKLAVTNWAGKRICLCVTDPLDVIAMVQAMEQQGGSLLLVHRDTPKEKVIELATEANCHGYFFDKLLHFEVLNETAPLDEAGALYQFSSGTTGKAKQIKRTWAQITREIAAYNERMDVALTPIVLAPVTHSYGLICGVLAAIARGVEPVIVATTNIRAAVKAIQQHERHLIYAVPFLLSLLASYPNIRLHHVMTSGTVLSLPFFEKVKQVSDVISQQYGCSEVGCISVGRDIAVPNEIGQPLSHITVTTSAGNELLVHVDDETIATKDLVMMDGQHLRFMARLDDVINVSGLNVYPGDVEDVILALTGVKEAVVYRGVHPLIGETVHAQVVAEQLTAQQIREWCVLKLAAYQVPQQIEIVTSIAKTATGKISRKLLSEGALV